MHIEVICFLWKSQCAEGRLSPSARLSHHHQADDRCEHPVRFRPSSTALSLRPVIHNLTRGITCSLGPPLVFPLLPPPWLPTPEKEGECAPRSPVPHPAHKLPAPIAIRTLLPLTLSVSHALASPAAASARRAEGRGMRQY